MPGRERRKQKRFKVKDCILKCSKDWFLAFLSKPGGKAYPVVNLSAGGAEFLAPKDMEVGRPLRITLDVPALFEPITLRGEVRWTRVVPDRGLYRVGAKFIEVDKTTRKQLVRLENDPMLRAARRERGLLI
jgi:hypothetical protein